jgi:DNA-binding NarL/FixJ family response regulator
VEILRQLRGETRRAWCCCPEANNPKLIETLTLNVDGIVFKHTDPKHLVRCLRKVRESTLGRRERQYRERHRGARRGSRSTDAPAIEVVRAAVSGLSNKEPAVKVGVSESMITNHFHAIYERLQIEGRFARLLYLNEKALKRESPHMIEGEVSGRAGQP